METKGLLFIPDISGFTRFINEAEIEHSRFIIEELLEILINANDIGLEVSEIEGDAILFYKYGDAPDLKILYSQVEKMFWEFHRHITAYEYRRMCQCKACRTAIDLSLKVVTHYGEFTGYNVKNFSKLIGKDVIVAHQLLKNNIEQHEYWLVTKNLLQDKSPQGFKKWMTWDSSVKKTESGEIAFQYTPLTPLKNEIPPEPPLQIELKEKKKMLSVSREYETDIVTLFRTAGDFNLRSSWQEGVKAIEEVSHILPRVGTKCRCVMESGQTVIYLTSFSYNSARIEFSETDEKRKSSTYYTLEKTNGNRIRLTIDFYIERNLITEIIFRVMRKRKKEDTLLKSLQNLDALLKEVKLSTQEW